MKKLRWILEAGEDAYKAIEKRRFDLALAEKFFDWKRHRLAILIREDHVDEVSALFPEADSVTFEGVDVLLVDVSLDAVKAKLATHFELEEWKRDLASGGWVKV